MGGSAAGDRVRPAHVVQLGSVQVPKEAYLAGKAGDGARNA
jgi:hypothetical protein